MIFIHIPKTAGTSFRLGASDYFGPEHELRDYGKDIKATSPLVNRLVHKRKDYEAFRKKVDQQGITFITGHFPSKRYLPYFDKGTFVTFVRDPVQRVVSEYKHAVRLNGLKEPLSVFCRRPRQINRQWWFVRAIGIDNMAFIGLTERYERSIECINRIFHTNIPVLKKNLGKNAIEETHCLESKDADLIKSLNCDDMELYEAVKKRFEQSIQPERYTAEGSRLLGKVGRLRKGKIFGWAVDRSREVPVEVSIYLNDRLLGQTLANRYRPDLKEAGIKRSGCGGILFDIGQSNVNRGDTIRFREKITQQVIAHRKIR